MTALLIANNLTSALVVFTCWWLAHINARAKPPGRAIAAGYSLLGISVLFTALVRNLSVDLMSALPWMIVITKAILGVTFLLMIFRRSKRGQK